MKLLFVASSEHLEELLGMAQLAAAFGQEVCLWHPLNALTSPQAEACLEAGIAQLASDEGSLQHWLNNAARVVRL